MAKTYRTTVYCGTVNGKQITKTIRANSQRELNQKVAQLKSEILNNKNVYDTAIFGEWADKWIAERIDGNVSDGTLTEYKAAIKHLKAYYGTVCMRDIRCSDFQTFINTMAKENPNTHKPMAKKTLGDLKKVAKNIFDYAIENDISGISNFFSGIRIPKNAPQLKRRALTEREQQMIIDTPHTAQLPAMIMMFSGLRLGECLALKWSDFDLNKARIDVRRSVNFENNQQKEKDGGKSKNATRIVPIPQILVNYLREYRNGLNIITEYVCLSSTGVRYSKSSWRSTWIRYIKILNRKYSFTEKQLKAFKQNDTLPMLIEEFTPHYLRHTFATMLYLQDINPVSAKEILGHADIQTTINIYTDLKTFYKPDLSEEYRTKLQSDFKITA